MKYFSSLLFAGIIFMVCACSNKEPNNFVFVEGGPFVNNKSGHIGKDVNVDGFYISKYEVTQKEWIEIMGNNPSRFKAEDLPVDSVCWYDCIDYCNKRSIAEGLKTYYNVDKVNKDTYNESVFDTIKWKVTINEGANGYRLPTKMEWDYAAGGGQRSKSYIYSGSDDIDKVAWYWQNSGEKPLSGLWQWSSIERNHNRTHPVGNKNCNELGLYDMSGNVSEWCWDLHEVTGDDDIPGRIWKGGGWIGADFCCKPSFEYHLPANGKGPDLGFRVCYN